MLVFEKLFKYLTNIADAFLFFNENANDKRSFFENISTLLYFSKFKIDSIINDWFLHGVKYNGR